jgi:hypothetical protein
VGVRWERAVTWDRDDELRRFIAHTFGLSLIQVTEEPGFAGSRHVYRFRSSLRTPVGIDAPTRIPARPHMPPQRDWGDGAEEHAFGAVSVMLDRRALRFDADLYARLVTDGGLLDCRARTLGASTMVLDVPVSAARGPGAPAQVLLEIQTRDGPVDVGCGCRVVQQVPAAIEGWAGMEMHITATDEGSFPGILQRWLRWAYLRQLAAD